MAPVIDRGQWPANSGRASTIGHSDCAKDTGEEDGREIPAPIKKHGIRKDTVL
ncbi:hypothetical protein [Microbulbifer halophilus]|uniref:hypothetical protein n=1 Tax=Microbulbifer halophilus TaxID=453963 RepID=UPI00360BD66E